LIFCRTKSRLHKLTPSRDTHKSITIVTKQPYFNLSILVMGTSSTLTLTPAMAPAILPTVFENRQKISFWIFPYLCQKFLLATMFQIFELSRQKSLFLSATIFQLFEFSHQNSSKITANFSKKWIFAPKIAFPCSDNFSKICFAPKIDTLDFK